jgi:Rod binding domain-containing protein
MSGPVQAAPVSDHTAPQTLRTVGKILPPVAPQPASSLPPEKVAKLAQTAKEFEAMALGQLLAPMFNTVDTAHSKFGGGDGEATWKPMLVDAIGKQIAAHGGLGLAAPVLAAMLRMQEKTP